MNRDPDKRSVLAESARRLDPVPYAGRLIIVATALSFLGLGLMTTWQDVRIPETALAEIQREARMAPWVVTVFFVGLAMAGTTKRLFGFGKSGAIGVLLGIASLVACASGLWFLQGRSALFFALLVAALVVLVVRQKGALGPMLLWTTSAVLFLLSTHLGLTRTLPASFEAELAMSAAVLTTASALGLMPKLVRLKGRER